MAFRPAWNNSHNEDPDNDGNNFVPKIRDSDTGFDIETNTRSYYLGDYEFHKREVHVQSGSDWAERGINTHIHMLVRFIAYSI